MIDAALAQVRQNKNAMFEASQQAVDSLFKDLHQYSSYVYPEPEPEPIEILGSTAYNYPEIPPEPVEILGSTG
jgi:hypothetical protein